MPRLSVIVITKNEAAQIGACLECLQWADEIIVVDTGSTDDTTEIAQKHATRVVRTEWRGYAGTKSLAMEETTGDWVLWVDADERVTAELADEIRTVVAYEAYRGYYVARKAIFLGRWIKHCGWYPGYVCRLFQKQYARFNHALVHEGVIVDGPSGYLSHPMIHYTDPSLEHYLEKFNTYTTLAARELYEKDRPFLWRDLLIRPPFAFMKMYILKRGFLDGIQGLILCVLSGCYVFTKYAKLWHLRQEDKE